MTFKFQVFFCLHSEDLFEKYCVFKGVSQLGLWYGNNLIMISKNFLNSNCHIIKTNLLQHVSIKDFIFKNSNLIWFDEHKNVYWYPHVFINRHNQIASKNLIWWNFK